MRSAIEIAALSYVKQLFPTEVVTFARQQTSAPRTQNYIKVGIVTDEQVSARPHQTVTLVATGDKFVTELASQRAALMQVDFYGEGALAKAKTLEYAIPLVDTQAIMNTLGLTVERPEGPILNQEILRDNRWEIHAQVDIPVRYTEIVVGSEYVILTAEYTLTVNPS